MSSNIRFLYKYSKYIYYSSPETVMVRAPVTREVLGTFSSLKEAENFVASDDFQKRVSKMKRSRTTLSTTELNKASQFLFKKNYTELTGNEMKQARKKLEGTGKFKKKTEKK